ncbi:MAG: ribosome silencing factor [Gemmatimonadales bacterium]|nr:MAG: ribosome silencing factor [Gemmatimonadales bacterium]
MTEDVPDLGSETPAPQVEKAARLALERKARDVTALDLRGISSAADWFLVVTGASDIQIRAIAEHVIDTLKSEGIRPGHVEGIQSGRWVLIDYIDWVVHVFHPEAREFYQLERLWGDAPVHHFGDEADPA